MSYYRMHRGWMENPILDTGVYDRRSAWAWLIEHARWEKEPKRVRVGRVIVTVNRGQLAFSLSFLAEKWGWSKTTVHRFIENLKDETMIGTDTGTGVYIITICNYEKYQNGRNDGGTDGGTQSGTQAEQRIIREEYIYSEDKSSDEPDDSSQIFSEKLPEPDLKKVVFDTGLSWLASRTGKQAKTLRPLIGKWCKDWGDGKTLAAILKAQTESAVEPVAFIEGVLKNGGKHEANRGGGGRNGMAGGGQQPASKPRILSELEEYRARLRIEAAAESVSAGEGRALADDRALAYHPADVRQDGGCGDCGDNGGVFDDFVRL